jgi:hypothetical protein
MKNTIWVVPIEPLDNRYTKQWFETIPILIQEKTNDYNVININVEGVKRTPSKGAFLDFAHTNIYKARQVELISDFFACGAVTAGDKFLVTDAWSFVVIAIKYMSDLFSIPVEIHGIWHAGAYDPSDILGLKMQKPWPYDFERSIFHACDYNYFGTHFHRDMFLRNLGLPYDSSKAICSGQPHNAIVDAMNNRVCSSKKNYILWPHRYNEDKQPAIAEDLAKHLSPDYKLLITQKMNLTKDEYYDLMCQSKAVFSCALHENLGISVMEGVLAGAIPIVPNRASYEEMYLDDFRYPSEWTSSYESYEKHKPLLISYIKKCMEAYNENRIVITEQKVILLNEYLNANKMIDNLIAKR